MNVDWWQLYIALNLLALVAAVWLIPHSYRLRYFECPTDVTCRLAVFFQHSIWTVALLQQFTNPSSLPDGLRFIGADLFVLGHALVIWARRVNPYAMPVVVAPERLITTGPYAWIAHPMYTGLVCVALGSLLLLAQSWAAIPVIFFVGVLFYRIHVEGRFLAKCFPDGN